MPFYPPDAAVPAELRTPELFLRMLSARDVELDYDAVMASRETLLAGSGGRWPREGFTPAENLADLQEHEADHLARTSFTYTVMTHDETRCLGCVYINPLARLLERYSVVDGDHIRVGAHDAVVYLWARPDYAPANLDGRLLAALRPWLNTAWAFTRVVFRAGERQARHRRLYEEAGLRRLCALARPGESDMVLLYGV